MPTTIFDAESISIRVYENASQPHVTVTGKDSNGNVLNLRVPVAVFQSNAAGFLEAQFTLAMQEHAQDYQAMRSALNEAVEAVEGAANTFAKAVKGNFNIRLQRSRNNVLDEDEDGTAPGDGETLNGDAGSSNRATEDDLVV